MECIREKGVVPADYLTKVRYPHSAKRNFVEPIFVTQLFQNDVFIVSICDFYYTIGLWSISDRLPTLHFIFFEKGYSPSLKVGSMFRN